MPLRKNAQMCHRLTPVTPLLPQKTTRLLVPRRPASAPPLPCDPPAPLYEPLGTPSPSGVSHERPRRGRRLRRSFPPIRRTRLFLVATCTCSRPNRHVYAFWCMHAYATYIHIYIYIYTHYIYIYTYTHYQSRVCILVYACICYVYLYLYLYIHTLHLYLYIHTLPVTCMHSRACMHTVTRVHSCLRLLVVCVCVENIVPRTCW